MQINEYIQKNLSSLNFNVLSSIYEKNGLELTEEIKSYLKETPKNTNLAILEQLNESGNKKTKIFEGTVNFTVTQGPYRPLAHNYQTLTGTFDTSCNSLIVDFENEEYELAKNSNGYNSTNGIFLAITDNGEISGGITQASFPITIQQGQLYNIKIYAVI